MTILIAAGTLLLTGAAEAQSTPDADGANLSGKYSNLDGRRYKAGIVRTDSRANSGRALTDRLIFRNGKFLSEICRRYNFKEAPYSVRYDGNQIHFSVVLRSHSDGVMIWKGIIRGRTLNGTMRWIRKRWYRTIDVTHRIQGVLEPATDSNRPSSN